MNITRLVIIREDGFMSINGRGLTIDLADMPPDLHAVQWYGAEGHIERIGQMNQPIARINWHVLRADPGHTLGEPEMPTSPAHPLSEHRGRHRRVIG